MMAKNPLDDGQWSAPSRSFDEEGLYEFAASRNLLARRIGADWWYQVVRRTLSDGSNRLEVEKLEGYKAIAARAAVQGKPIRTWHPQPGEAEAIRSHAAKCIAQGITQAEFNAMVDRQSP